MTTAFIIHGTYGNPEENWFSWLKKELEKLNCQVFVPHFPTPENQSLKEWLNIFKEYKHYVDENTIFIGHSLGPAFILTLLEQVRKQVKAALFVAGFIGKLNNPTFDNINKTFTEKNFDWTTIKKNCKQFFLYQGENDPYVPLAKAKELAKELDVKIQIIPEAGHFNEQSGYKTFDTLLEEIKRIL